ncbi:hypothetical protein Rumal_3591 (plasmid) [Ruminococcus albus 7 = DSM 20455]|uniref:Uncharacterized protein n=2 Tax=Ruminococcus albus TaxID=1264 RepID=E6UK36_RUMA7|nr:hypothetical protein [Ruminococcus albus]ADU24032.1 hypothetical protein Rumal_3591 [Ruminococcus albus 7 = DSM 20455]
MALTYKISSFVKNITSPVIVLIGNKETEFQNGSAAYEKSYDKNYLVAEIRAKDNKVCIVLKENDKTNDINWIGEEQASFF